MRGPFDTGRRGRAVVRASPAGPHPRLHPAPAAARDRARHRPGAHALPAAAGSTSPPARSARGGPACWPWSTSSRGSRSRPARGRSPSSRRGSRATNTAGSRTCATPASSCGGGCRRAPPIADATAPAGLGHAVAGHAGDLRPPRGPSLAPARRAGRCGAGRARPRRGARRARRPATGTGPCSTPSCAAPPDRLPVEVEEGLWDLVARGHRDRRRVPGRALVALGPPGVEVGASATSNGCAPGLRRAPTRREGGEGRWALLPAWRTPTTTRPRNAGRTGGRTAAGALGRRLLGPHGPREPGRAVARGGVGAAPARSPRLRAGRPLRDRLRRRAVRRCPKRSTSCAASGAANAAGRSCGSTPPTRSTWWASSSPGRASRPCARTRSPIATARPWRATTRAAAHRWPTPPGRGAGARGGSTSA